MTFRTAIGVCTTLLAFLAAATSPHALAAPDAGKPFRGHDDRVILDSAEPPFPAIGRLNLGAGRQFCSGTLIAPDKVVTAAHCLIDARTRRPYRPDQVHFAAGQRRAAIAGHARARCLVPLKRRAADGAPDIAKSSDDVAIIVLSRPLNVPQAALAHAYTAEPGPLSHPAYSKSRPYLLSVHDNCKLLHKSRGMWLTDCDTGHGSSGGPVFANSATNPQLIAVMSGIMRARGQVYSIAVPITIWGQLAQSAKCDRK